jgi:hypothetical protein
MLTKVQQVIFDHLASLNDARERPVSTELTSRASSAGKCSRAIALKISGLPASNPPAGESLVNFWIGDKIHDLVQTAMLEKYPDAEKELEGSIGDYITGHCDLRTTAEDGKKIVWEIKSIADFAFMKATGISLKSSGRWHKKDEESEGAKTEHLLQCGIYTRMFDADYMGIVYVRKTATKDEPVAYEWRHRAEEYTRPIDLELERHKNIVDMVRANYLPEREFEGRIITNPLAKENRWPCGYCNHLESCVKLGEGVVEIK